MNIQAVFWDFDGVILDSMPIREIGFREIFKDESPILVEKLLSFHRRNGGLSRFVKIKYFFEELKQQICSEEIIQSYAESFSLIMRKLLIDKKFLIPSTLAFIQKYYSDYRFYIASGSEQNELRFLCDSLGISPYFKGIYGSPTPKTKILTQLLQENNFVASSCLMIGDAINDYEAAKNNHIPFWGFQNPELQAISDIFITDFSTIALK